MFKIKALFATLKPTSGRCESLLRVVRVVWTAYHLLLVYPDQRTSPDRSAGPVDVGTSKCQLSALTIEKGGVFLFSASLRLRQNAIFPRAFNVICPV